MLTGDAINVAVVNERPGKPIVVKAELSVAVSREVPSYVEMAKLDDAIRYLKNAAAGDIWSILYYSLIPHVCDIDDAIRCGDSSLARDRVRTLMAKIANPNVCAAERTEDSLQPPR